MPFLFAPGRARRPHDLTDHGPRPDACPFCPGEEAQTPPETQAVRPDGSAADGPGWLVRAFPNLFPALPPAEGVHEVVVNTPRHVTRLDELTAEEAGRATRIWLDRVLAVGRDARGLWPLAFVNQGALAGASLAHTHAQVVGLPGTAAPYLVARAAAITADPDLLRRDMDAPDRRIAEGEGLVAWCPLIPSLSGAIRVAPPEPAPVPGDRAEALGRLVRRLAGAVRTTGTEALNVCVHTAGPGVEDFHWHADVMPRRGTFAGLELGAGAITLVRAPAEAAAALRAGLEG